MGLDGFCLLAKFFQFLQAILQILGIAHDADATLHHLLQFLLNQVGIGSFLPIERSGCRPHQFLHTILVHLWKGIHFIGVLDSAISGQLAENEKVGQRIAPQSIGSMHPTRAFT